MFLQRVSAARARRSAKEPPVFGKMECDTKNSKHVSKPSECTAKTPPNTTNSETNPYLGVLHDGSLHRHQGCRRVCDEGGGDTRQEIRFDVRDESVNL